MESLVVECVEVGFAGQEASQPADGILDGALLPGAVGITEEGSHAEVLGQDEMFGELGAVVEGDGSA